MPTLRDYHFRIAPVSALVAIAAYFARYPFVMLAGLGFHSFLRSASSLSDRFTLIVLFGMSISMIVESLLLHKPFGTSMLLIGQACALFIGILTVMLIYG